MHSKQTSKGFYIAAILVLLGYSFDTTRVDKLSIRFELEPKDKIVLYGSTVVLDCLVEFSNNVSYTVAWYVERHLFKPTSEYQKQLLNGSLQIENFQESNEGEYFCMVSSGSNARLSRSVTIEGAAIESTLKDGHVIELNIREGHNALLYCGLEGTPAPNIIWSKDSQKIIGNDRLFILPSNDLHLMNATMEDVGLYECSGHNIAGEIKAAIFRITLTETDPLRSIKQLSSKGKVDVLVGQPAVLECLWSFSQSVWYRGNSHLEHDPKLGSNLLITNATISDSGDYTCQSLVDPNLKSIVTLVVAASPTLLVPHELAVKIRAGNALNLTCQFNGHPIKSVQWLKNGKILKNTSRLMTTLSMVNQSCHLYQAELRVDHSIPLDSGVYQCLIFNQVGAVDVTFFVSTVKPAPPQKLKAKPTLDREMELSWDEPPDTKDVTGYSIYYWSSQDEKEMQFLTDRRKETIIHMLPYTNYTFFVRAHTKYDISEPSEMVSQMTNEEVPISLPQVTLEAEGISSIKVEWDSLTSMQANGVIVAHKILLRNYTDRSTKTYNVNGSVYNITIKDLKPENRYDILVLSGTKVGFPKLENLENEQWQSIFLSEDKDGPLYYPENLSVDIVNSTTAVIRWEVKHFSDSVELYGFQIQCRSVGKKVLKYFSRESDRTYLLSNLDAGSSYEIEIRSLSKVGRGNPALSTFVTPTLPTPKGQFLIALKGKTLNDTAVKLSIVLLNKSISWDNAEICYGVHEKQTEFSCHLWKNVDVTSSEIVINNLLPLTKYYFRVHQFKTWLSNIIICKTGLPTPKDLQFIDAGNDQLNISWSFPLALKDNVSFKVSYKYDADGRPSDWYHDLVHSPCLFYVLGNYTPNRVYSIQVISIFGDVESAKSDILHVNAANGKEGHKGSYNPISVTVIGLFVVASVIAIVLLATLALRRWHNRGKHKECFGRDPLKMTSVDQLKSEQQNSRACNGNSSYLHLAIPSEPLLASQKAAFACDDNKTAFSLTQETSVRMQKLNESAV